MTDGPKEKSNRPSFKPTSAPRAAAKPKGPAPATLSEAKAPPKRRESLLEKLRGPNSKRYFFIFLGSAILIQIAHDLEHVVQTFQVFVFGVPRPTAGGLLGSIFDFPVVHFAYNFLFFVALLWAVAWAYGLGGFRKLDRIGMWTLLIAAGIQTYHTAEHVIQITQEAATGTQRPPGFIGLFQDNVVAHLLLNSIVWVLPAISMWRFGGFSVFGSWLIGKFRRPLAA